VYYNTQGAFLKKEPATVMKAICHHLQGKSETSVSELSKAVGINRRTAKKYLELLRWLKTVPPVYEYKRRGGSRVFSMVSPETIYEFNRLSVEDEMHPNDPLVSFERRCMSDARNDIMISMAKLALASSKLKLPREVLTTATNILRRFQPSNIVTCHNLRVVFVKHLLASVLYIACHRNGIPQKIEDILVFFNMEEKDLDISPKMLQKYLQERIRLRIHVLYSHVKENRYLLEIAF